MKPNKKFEGEFMSNKVIPKNGLTKDEISNIMGKMSTEDVDYKNYKAFSLVYYLGEEHEKMLEEAYQKYADTNFLNPMAFLSLKKMEKEIVRFGLEMLNGNNNCTGSITSGGTESILLACKTYRDIAYQKKIKNPEMIICESAHPAFIKAAEYFNLKLIKIPMDKNYKIDLNVLSKSMTSNTAMIAVSAPQYAHGVIDPVEEVAKMAFEKSIPLHVDSCIGGFILPWLEKLGENIPKFDFRVPGVTSISADIHKYGYSSKGTSLLVYSSMEYFREQIFVDTEFPGGVYACSTLLGSRSGGPIAAAWASLMNLGESGFMKYSQMILDTKKKIINAINEMPELEIIGEPDSSLISFQSVDKKIDILSIADQLEEKGWFIDRQSKPISLHCTLMPGHLKVIDQYIEDLKQAIFVVRKNPGLKSSGKAPMYGMMSKMPFRKLVAKNVRDTYAQLFDMNSDSVKIDDGLSGVKGKLLKTINKIL
jgi:glutamate/tyrosine decarboxylase-like PLP-dependent enzyme